MSVHFPVLASRIVTAWFNTLMRKAFLASLELDYDCRNQSDEYALAYPTQQATGVENYGTWPVIYEASPHTLLLCCCTDVQ